MFPSALADKHDGLTALSSQGATHHPVESGGKWNEPGSGALPEPLLLGLLGLGPVLVHQLEELGGWREIGVRLEG